MQQTITHGDRELVRVWASDVEKLTLKQAEKSARCEAVAGPIALMPDAHVGIGATVGSVIPTETAIIPAAVGVDIGCGMIAVQTSLTAADLPQTLKNVLMDIERVIPAGFSAHGETTVPAGRWLDQHPLPSRDGLSNKQVDKVGTQLGSLGGGNHFVEICLDESESVWAVLHSGSRGIGNILATKHIRKAQKVCQDQHRVLEDRDLAYFLQDDPEFHAYIRDMRWSQDYAAASRNLMMDALLKVLRKHVKRFRELQRINAHHNYTEQETHDGRTLWITRKGAIRAGVGDRGIIPGSMGTGTYIVTGLGNPASYHSASHGAGRRFSRGEARRRFTGSDLKQVMKGRTWQEDKATALVDESPMAYKDIDQVMADQADLVRVDYVLHAVLNYKGTG